MSRRFTELGGVPRHVFDEAQEDPDNLALEKAIARVTWMGTILSAMAQAEAPDEVSHRIIMLDVPKWRQGARHGRRKRCLRVFTTFVRHFIGNFIDCEVGFVSKYVRDRVLTECLTRYCEELKRFLTTSEGLASMVRYSEVFILTSVHLDNLHNFLSVH